MQYPKEIKSQTIARYKSKESVISISNETGIPRSTIYRWLNESKNSNHPNIKDKEIKELERKVEKALGRRVKIKENGKLSSISIGYTDYEDLEKVLLALCGKDFVDSI